MSEAGEPCFCGSGQPFSACCAPLIEGTQRAATAEQLMRSRYSAFASNAFDYLVSTHHPAHRANNEREELSAQSSRITWQALRILDTQGGLTGDLSGIVEFKAWFIAGSQLHCLHERSRFVHENGQWFYADAEFCNDLRANPGRNDSCFCGSGRKYKHCHAR